MTIRTAMFHGAIALAVMFAAASCSDSSPNQTPDAGAPPVGFHQVEQLARPGINEALLINEAFNAGFNATAPSFAGVPPDTLNAVVGEAKMVLKALYLGGCLLNGALGLSADQGVKPAGMTCHAVGPTIWTEGTLAGVTLTQASKDAAQKYADKVFSQFIPDVLRVDTGVDSNYLTLCGDPSSTPLLCGGRFVNNDVIDVTYNYLLNGAATTKGPFDQVRALTGDGVNFSMDDANNVDNVVVPDPKNAQQGHPNISMAFPYSAPPF